MKVKLYVLLGAHPSRSAMLMLDHKGIGHDTVTLPAGFQPYVMRFLGFRAQPGFSRQVDDQTPRMLRKADQMGTVPALRVGDRRLMTNHEIARFLDELQPEPPLFPSDPDHRRAVEVAERWADDVFQMVARRVVVAAEVVPGRKLLNHGDDGRLGPLLYRNRILRRLVAHVIARIAFRVNSETERNLLAELPGMLDRIDLWIEEGVLNGEELYVADFMIAPSLAMLTYRADTAEEIDGRPAAQLLDRLLPDPSPRRAPDRSVSASSPARPVDYNRR
jgi:glutathione S-transferase